MKIGFAARWDPKNKRSWSGTAYYTYQQIAKRYDTEIYNYKWTWRVREWLTMQKSLNRKFFGKKTAVEFLRSYAKYFSKELERDLKRRPVDVLFVSASSQLMAYCETSIPVIYMTDATFQQLQGYYPGFSELADYNVRQGIELDKKAFQKFSHCMLASGWNKDSAIKDYGVDPSRISIVPCGANLDQLPGNLVPLNSDETLRLLFLGVEWERKGGDIAIEAVKILREKNVQVELKIIGCVPPYPVDSNYITVIPFLDKNNPLELQQLSNILEQTHMLFLPTRAECAGVVFSEASAYGIPSITTLTGGVGTYVRENVNGYTLPLAAGPKDYADQIERLWRDKARLEKMRQSARQYYEDFLNWDVWGEKFEQIVEKLATDRL